MPTILTIFGRRAGAIKMAPVVRAIQQHPAHKALVCISFQQRENLDPILELFGIGCDYTVELTDAGQDQAQLMTGMISGLQDVLAQAAPDLVLISGDATTTLAASLACVYRKIPVGHVEAGLRTHNPAAPWPEELNRQLISRSARLHFAPTGQCRQNLLAEGIGDEAITVTGSTLVDALWQGLDWGEQHPEAMQQLARNLPFLPPGQPVLLVSAQRKEHFGAGMKDVCEAINTLAGNTRLQIVFPVSLDPAIQTPVYQLLDWHDNLHLIEPTDYLPSAYLLKQADIVLTDAISVQHGAISLGKPVLVMRAASEFDEGLQDDRLQLVGTDSGRIVSAVQQALARLPDDFGRSEAYGDGNAAAKIVDAITKWSLGRG